jgi:SAM-dependent methyltransferase
MVEQALAMGYAEDEIKSIPQDCLMGLGCGNPTALADLKEGQIVLDLGSGTGLDIFLAAQKVGNTGKAIGVDMTERMARRAHQTARYHGYSNAQFILGEIEYLPVEDTSVDIIISNCVINLSPDKPATFSEIYRVLKSGGSAVVSDLVTVGKVSSHLRQSFEAWAGCIAGALERETYLSMIGAAGFSEVCLLSEQTFFELGLSKASGGRIESIQVKAHKT